MGGVARAAALGGAQSPTLVGKNVGFGVSLSERIGARVMGVDEWDMGHIHHHALAGNGTCVYLHTSTTTGPCDKGAVCVTIQRVCV